MRKNKKDDILNYIEQLRKASTFSEISNIEDKLLEIARRPTKTTKENHVYFTKNRNKEIVLPIIQNRFPDKREFFMKLWNKFSTLPEMTLPNTMEFMGVVSIAGLDPETPESQILQLILTLNDSVKEIDEGEDIKKVIKKIRSSAKKYNVKTKLLNDLIESVKTKL